ncbi:hypothetical protein PVK06_013177 [Gossypium arboreum]|uniref:TF-B3 domain-containing protein n=1 Tax=Gossypium arboreum TaxID=29729 RepID=A0ABR0QEL2_GOSAR|nr:hypothetical protein PVK06_013177 [Gossypium arboreum]
MAEIGIDTLAPQHAAGWDVDTPLPHVFTVAVGSRRFRVHCRRYGGRYRIYGDNWSSFVESNVGAVVSLYAREEDQDFHNLQY